MRKRKQRLAAVSVAVAQTVAQGPLARAADAKQEAVTAASLGLPGIDRNTRIFSNSISFNNMADDTSGFILSFQRYV